MLRPLLILLLLTASSAPAVGADALPDARAAEKQEKTPGGNAPRDKIWPTTRDLYEGCKEALKNPESFRRSFCAGYIEGIKIGISVGALYTLSGVRDGIEQMNVIERTRDNLKVCWMEDVPPPAGLMLAEEFASWVDKNGEAVMKKNAEDSFFRALQELHPCKKDTGAAPAAAAPKE
jgi:Ssp1 endopeptidase immunity protein Rap1a